MSRPAPLPRATAALAAHEVRLTLRDPRAGRLLAEAGALLSKDEVQAARHLLIDPLPGLLDL